MRWQVALRVIGSVLLVAGLTVMSLQVHVGGSGAAGRSCGSSLDVITDRTGWEAWYAQDIVDAPVGSAVPLMRTVRCPGAVNGRTQLAAVFGTGGLLALVAAGAVRRRGAVPAIAGPLGRRLRRLGTAVTLAGVALVIAGVVALAVLLANADAALFVFVRRSVVATIGLVVLTPILALVAGGRALTLLARALEDREAGDEPA